MYKKLVQPVSLTSNFQTSLKKQFIELIYTPRGFYSLFFKNNFFLYRKRSSSMLFRFLCQKKHDFAYLIKCKFRNEPFFSKYSLTRANDHLRITTTCLQRPLYSIHSKFSRHKLLLNNDYLSTTTTNLGSQGWSLYIGLTVVTISMFYHLC